MIVQTSESALRNVIGAFDARCEVALVEVARFSAPQAAQTWQDASSEAHRLSLASLHIET